MLSSEWKASLRAWSEGVKYCWRLEDWAEDDPAVPPDQSISRREAGAWACTGPQLADLSWPRRCEDWGWGWGDSDRHWPVRATAGHNKGAAQQLCLSERSQVRWAGEQGHKCSLPGPGPGSWVRVMSGAVTVTMLTHERRVWRVPKPRGQRVSDCQWQSDETAESGDGLCYREINSFDCYRSTNLSNMVKWRDICNNVTLWLRKEVPRRQQRCDLERMSLLNVTGKTISFNSIYQLGLCW